MRVDPNTPGYVSREQRAKEQKRQAQLHKQGKLPARITAHRDAPTGTIAPAFRRLPV